VINGTVIDDLGEDWEVENDWSGIPDGFEDLEGVTSDDGTEWRWDGLGWPRDSCRNTVFQIVAMKADEETKENLVKMVKIGEWGFAEHRFSPDLWGAGHIWCREQDREAVQAAYDAIEEGDPTPDVLDDVFKAGGVYIRD
jgi:hypothetical protein